MIRRPSLLPVLMICAGVLAPGLASAQDVPAAQVEDGSKRSEDAYKAHLIAFPFINYTPETKLAFGGGGILNFRAGRKKEQTRASTVWAFGTYTLAKQFQVMVRPEIYFERNNFFLSGNIRYERTPQNFFGIGDSMPTTEEESYTPRIMTVQVGVKKKFLGHLYAGIQYDFEQMTMEKVEPGGLLSSGSITGSRGGLCSGFSISVDWDTRDGVLYPRKGVFFLIAADTYGALSGSDFAFTSFKLDCRKYFLVAPDQVLALQMYIKSTAGEVPFHKLALLGGETLMRGYYKGRYRDKDILAVQAEYRVMVTKRIGVVGFAGLADVFPAFSEFTFRTIKHSVGTGIRYMVNKREGTTLRMDMAWGKASFGLYFTAQEAF
ncbi:MAG: BamA/TamA family outer membrane protein [Candidatus Aminicenantes bacterium]|nr:BamA/TamA family outer membrane protein [Candidatus Aminicenantes bacterium]